MHQVSERDFNSEPIKNKWNEFLMYMHLDLGQEYEYCKLWWNFYKDSKIKKDLLLVVASDNQFNAIWPMMIRKQYFQRGIFVIGHIDGFITDYCFPIVQPSIFYDNLNSFIEFLNKRKIKWNYLKLNIPEWTKYLSESSLKNKLSFYKIKIHDNYSSLVLNNKFEDYISSLGPKTRADVRHYLRIFKQEDFKFNVFTGTEIVDKIKDLIELNQLNWNIFDYDNRFFLEEISKSNCNSSSRKIILPTLQYRDRVIACVFGFVNKENCFLHTAGVDRKKIKSISPGITLYVLFIQYLIDNEIYNLDLSPGAEQYKLRLGAKIGKVQQLVVFKNRYSKILYNSGLLLKRTARTLIPA